MNATVGRPSLESSVDGSGSIRPPRSGGVEHLALRLLEGKPAESLLVKAIEYTDSAFQMPPDGKLSELQIADLKQWIADGAIDPRQEDSEHGSRTDSG